MSLFKIVLSTTTSENLVYTEYKFVPKPSLLKKNTRVLGNVFLRAKAKRLQAWTCEAYV